MEEDRVGSQEPRLVWIAIKAFYQHRLPPIMAIGTLLWLFSVLLFQPPRPPVGTYIACLACLAVVVTIWPPESNWSKAGWLMVFFACTGLEIAILYQERNENQKQQVDAHNQERDAFKSIAGGLTASITANQQAFDKTMRGMRGIATLSTEDIAEATGGDSFCYINMFVWGRPGNPPPTEITASIVQQGRHPLFHVDTVITDLDAFDSALKAGVVGTARQGFPTIEILTRMNLYHPVATYQMTVNTESRSFYVELFARNGKFDEQVRIRRLANGQIAIAKLVAAFYFTHRRGIVLEQVPDTFPKGIIDDDKSWQAFKNRWKPITVEQ